jgi:putative endonuclease
MILFRFAAPAGLSSSSSAGSSGSRAAVPGLSRAQWSVYMVRCRDGTLYTGIATDVRRRIAEHAQSSGKGAKYLRGKGPLQLVFVRTIGSKDHALRVESQIKQLPKVKKEELVEQFRRCTEA